MGYEPNADAVKYFMREVMPGIQEQQSDACLSVVGKEAESDIRQLHDGQTCFVHGHVPDVTPYYESAGLVIAPIRLGAGTRLKILEALMFGKAVVASSVAIEGLDVRPGIDLEVADTPSSFANACLELMRDESRQHRLGRGGQRTGARAVRMGADWQTGERRSRENGGIGRSTNVPRGRLRVLFDKRVRESPQRRHRPTSSSPPVVACTTQEMSR